jgi:predicted kinase
MPPGIPAAKGLRLPRCTSVCYKRYMRKWMSERLKRRKKTGDGPTKEATKAPEPLQPRFYDDEPAAPAEAPGEVPVVEAKRAAKPARESEAVSDSEAPAASAAGEGKPRPVRRRRSRGGRGGSRPRPAATAPAETETPAPGAASAGKTPVAQAASPHAVPVAAGASKGTVVLAIGLPGSGKSSWFKRHNIHPLSSDLLRELLFDDAQEQRFQDLVFSNLRSMLKARLIARRPMNYVDATNLTPHDRHSWIKLAKDYGYDVQGLFFDVPLEVCMERHQRRGRVVPEDIMRKMAGKLKAPTFEEGFSKITVVRVKQKEAGAE